MKKIFLLLVISILHASDFTLVSKDDTYTTIQLNGQGETCNIYVRDFPLNGSRISSDRTCVSMINSKKQFIICTRKKTICKIDSEIINFIDSYNSVKQSAVNYSFIGIDDLEAFPSDYVGKLSYLKCKRSTPSENRKGGYDIMAKCANVDGHYGFGSNNPFKIIIRTNSRDTARALARSKNQEKLFLGTVKSNSARFAITRYIFVIDEVHLNNSSILAKQKKSSKKVDSDTLRIKAMKACQAMYGHKNCDYKMTISEMKNIIKECYELFSDQTDIKNSCGG